MAIAPIDLQAIFTQVDKVGKAQAAQREGQAIHQAIQGAQIQRKTEEQIQQINETQDMGEGVEKLNERTKHQSNNKKDENKKENEDKDEEIKDKSGIVIFKDPVLGNKIDISY